METQNDSEPPQRSWFDWIGQVLNSEPKDRGELIETLREAQRRELLDHDTHAMIEGVFRFSELRVRDIMVPRAQMIVVQREATLEQMLPTIVHSGHSRFPVIDDSRDEVVGILLAKDLLRYALSQGEGHFDLQDLLRPPVFIPESKRISVLLKEFRSSHNHMAIVADEYGGVGGLVTIEDVLEQIVGEIDDEHDPEEGANIYPQGEGYVVKALTEIEEFNAHFGTSLADDEFDTVGGLVTHELGHLPKQGEVAMIEGFRFEVLRAGPRRLYALEVTPPTPAEAH